ncbi:MAG: CHAT domain-containing protein, partial [Bacteroidota bacterium]
RVELWNKIMTSFKSAEVSQVLAVWNFDVFESAILSAYQLYLIAKDSSLLYEMFSSAEQSKNAELMKYNINSSGNNRVQNTFRYDTTLSVQDIQSTLTSDRALIEYSQCTDNIISKNFAFVITKNLFRIIPFETAANSDSAVAQYYEAIRRNEVNKYSRLSHSVYNEILKPAIAQLPKSIRHLTIIPDKRFSHFAFDALVIDTGNGFSTYRELKYLSDQYTISYSLGATVNEILKKDKSNATGNIVAFAPSFTSLSSLPFSKIALSELQRKVEGKYYFNDKASVGSFLQSAGSASVLHLATHAVADLSNPNESKVYFGDKEFLTLDSVYHLKINAELVVASACETAIGKEFYAEGMKSFARAFTYAGSKSTITTLWKVDDKATAEVFAKFYNYLLDGDAKDDALQKAKLDYRRNCKTDDEANPFYWSGIILTNDVSPIELKKKHSYVLALALSLVGLVGGVGFWRKKVLTKRRIGR